MIRDSMIERARGAVMRLPRNRGNSPNCRYITVQAMIEAGLTDKEIIARVPGLDGNTVTVYRHLGKEQPRKKKGDNIVYGMFLRRLSKMRR